MSTYTKGKSTKLSINFESIEFDCHGKGCCAETEIDPMLIEYLQKIRDHFGKPVTINSAYRCAKHNKKIGGASKSKHLYGQAADIKVVGVKPLKIAQYAESIGIKGIGQYSTFVHIDTRSNKYFWYGNGQDSRSTFGKYVDETDGSKSDAVVSPSVNPSANYVEITGSSVNVRKGPGTGYAKLSKTVRKGELYQVPDTDGWIAIRYKKEACWIFAKYVEGSKCIGSSVNIRSGPGMNYSIKGSAKKGASLDILNTNGWTPIVRDNVVRWVSAKYVSEVGNNGTE